MVPFSVGDFMSDLGLLVSFGIEKHIPKKKYHRKIMKVSKRSKNSNFKNIKLKTVYVEIERLKWSDVMKKRFWKKHRLLRPCVSRICRQLLNIELQKRKKERKSFPKEENGNPVNKKCAVKNTKHIYKKEGFADDFLTKEPPKKKLKFTNDDYGSGSDSESKNLEEKPPDTKDKNLINTDNPQIMEAAQVNGNDNVVPITKNSAKPLDKNSLTLYTKSGVKVLVMKSVTVPKSKVFIENKSLVNSSVELLSNDCNISTKDKVKNSCSADLNNKLDDIIRRQKYFRNCKRRN
ncbi:hypothetical protein Avbf_04920 [Armadillidium vulgare]|nr:hypothetical protein Avbf_04920 [Armadillidium vulgare]